MSVNVSATNLLDDGFAGLIERLPRPPRPDGRGARPGDHRDDCIIRLRALARVIEELRNTGRHDVGRRLRRRLHLARLPGRPRRRRAEARPHLHHRPRHRGAGPRPQPSSARRSSSATRSGCASWPRASRTSVADCSPASVRPRPGLLHHEPKPATSSRPVDTGCPSADWPAASERPAPSRETKTAPSHSREILPTDAPRFGDAAA